MQTQFIESLIHSSLSDEALYEIYRVCLTLTNTLKTRYSERLARYCLQQHNKQSEIDCLQAMNPWHDTDTDPF